MIEFLIASRSPATTSLIPGMSPPPFSTNCGPGDIELLEEKEEPKKGRNAKIPTQQITIIDWKVSL